MDRLDALLTPEEVDTWLGALQRLYDNNEPLVLTLEEQVVDSKVEADPEAAALFRQMVRFEWAVYYLSEAGQR